MPKGLAVKPKITTRRAMGIETEFGITYADLEQRLRAGANSAIMLSHLAIASYALLEDSDKQRIRWDYGDETPLRDARGFELVRSSAHPTQLTDEVPDALPSTEREHIYSPQDEIPPELDDGATIFFALKRAISNSVLTNGARWYVDHAHPEYSSPEVMSAREAVIWDVAGEEIARKTMRRLEQLSELPNICLYKNNTDSKGQSYGTHENYLVSRGIDFNKLAKILIPFFVTRQIIVGAGRVGIGTNAKIAGYQISSRADFFEAEVGLETTLNRPIINSRDEPHADASRYRRLHVIIGDANLYEYATFMKIAMTSLLLSLIELQEESTEQFLPLIEIKNPVKTLRDISHDLSLKRKYEVKVAGQDLELSAIEIQQLYLNAVKQAVKLQDDVDEETQFTIEQWEELLELLANNPSAASDRIEWLGKLSLLEQFKNRHDLTWEDDRLKALDIQFADLRADKSLYLKLLNASRVKRLVSPAEVTGAITNPPNSTRAYFRGKAIGKFRGHLDSAGWDSVAFKVAGAALKMRFMQVDQGSRNWCKEHQIDFSKDFDTLIAALTALEDER